MSESFIDDRSKLWNNLLSSQVALFSEAEFGHLADLPEWKAASVVADIGCGSGDYVARVAEAFPGKHYIGFDTSRELVSIARRKFSGTGITFHCTDIANADADPRFDCAILRFVVQHLEQPLDFFNSLGKLIQPNGLAVIIEPKLEASSSAPQLTNLSELIVAYEALAADRGAARAILKDQDGLERLIGSLWQVSNVEHIHSTHDRESWDTTAIANILYGWIDVIEACQCLSWDYRRLRCDVGDWLRSKGQKIDIVLSVTTLRLVGE